MISVLPIFHCHRLSGSCVELLAVDAVPAAAGFGAATGVGAIII